MMLTRSASASWLISIASTGFMLGPGFGDDVLQRPIADPGIAPRLNLRAQPIEPFALALVLPHQIAQVVAAAGVAAVGDARFDPGFELVGDRDVHLGHAGTMADAR